MIETISEVQMDADVTTARKNPLVMIVDDNLELLEELENLLKLGGYDVIAISDGTKVLDAAIDNKPDLILTDLKMSPKSGFQIAYDVSNSELLKGVPVVAMTGFFTEKQHLMMMKFCGIKTSILKPFRPLNLITQIEFAMHNSFTEEGTKTT